MLRFANTRPALGLPPEVQNGDFKEVTGQAFVKLAKIHLHQEQKARDHEHDLTRSFAEDRSRLENVLFSYLSNFRATMRCAGGYSG